ncbi:MAG TPA: BrnA antitoxin family protein [Chloroflexia bacterium]|nr:BrnA antitoxin family protein [Chloroflexia bacterium]
MKKPSETDWARVDALEDDAIDTSDIPALTDAQFAKMTLRVPTELTAVTVSVDPEVLAWFRSQGEDFEQRINAALRVYVEANRKSGSHSLHGS